MTTTLRDQEERDPRMSAGPAAATSLMWFRQDLRLADNPALAHAASRGRVVPVYVLDERTAPLSRPVGGAQRWWLHHSLKALAASLGGLVLLRGNPELLIPALAARVGAGSVFWNRCYEPHAIARDTTLKKLLKDRGLEVTTFNGCLLFEPWTVRKLDGSPFNVFTPFWRACLKHPPTPALGTPSIDLFELDGLGEDLAAWNLLPTHPDWSSGLNATWTPGEASARARLSSFLDSGLEGYATLRGRPDLPNVSRLSPHLHFGELSSRQIWQGVKGRLAAGRAAPRDVDKFLSELGWREFAYHLLFQDPAMPERNSNPAFDAYPWQSIPEHLTAWQRGRTGYPLVDAGMRELWATGYLPTRVRMVVASFLVKHLRIHWREGEAWFWDTLVDADLASNATNWQWVAGSAAYAAPYFRIFNPVEQGRGYDPQGMYIRRWCPELARLPDADIHAPFAARPATLAEAGVFLGRNYPAPIVDLQKARREALEGYASVLSK